MTPGTRAVSRPRTVALFALPGVVPFDLFIAGQVFGDPAPVLGARRYVVRVCGLEAGLVTMAGGLPIGVPRGIDALEEVETIVVPDLADVEAPVAPAALDGLRMADARGHASYRSAPAHLSSPRPDCCMAGARPRTGRTPTASPRDIRQ